VGDGAVLTTQVQLGGHAEVGAGATLGAGVMVHQWTRIGRWAMVGATSALNRDVLPFSLARGLCTVDFSWPSFIERGIEQFTGYGRRSKVPHYAVIDAPSHSVYGGNILARSEDWW